jgi:hypothetical protein
MSPKETPTPEEIWLGDWKARHLERIKATGASSIAEFLQRYPSEPYWKLSRRLDGYVAPMQLRILQFEEAILLGNAREALKDLLVRALNDHQKRGWGQGGRWTKNHASAQAEFIHETVRFLGPDAQEQAEKVVDSLDGLNPSRGWVPASISDPLIQKALK